MKTFPITAGSVSCSTGESFAIEALGSGTTGYVWFVAISDDEDAVELKTRSHQAEELVGALGAERFEFVARHAGHADVVFDLKRPWESESERTVKLQVKVRSR